MIGTRERIITAAEDVVLIEGVARLTLEKAARRAGVSKGGVLYHFPTRSALVAAMVARLADRFDASLTAHAAVPERRFAQAYVEESFAGPQGEHEERSERLGAAVLAAMASEPELLDPLRAAFDRWQANLATEALTLTGDPVRATIVRLACDGLWMSELFGLAPLSPELRERVRAALLAMVS